jgi:hypothetical protein
MFGRSQDTDKYRVLRKIFGPKREEDGSWRKSHDEIHSLYPSPNIVRVIKSRRMRWYAWGRGEVFTGFWLGGPKLRDHWEDLGVGEGKKNIKLDLKEMGTRGANWIQLGQDRVQWRAFINTVMNLRVP